jgi:epoxyqueuosine reductase QueG
MVAIFQAPITAAEVKEKAKALGADLVGIADGKVMDANPPDPANPRRPSDLSDHDADRVIVLARRLNLGSSRIPNWDERHKYYNDELTITMLEETALDLVLWLEEKGYPAFIAPPTHVDPWAYDGDPEKHMAPLISTAHAGVEAGLGTLGLNEQLLTPQFGPRVMLIAVLSSVPVEADAPMAEALCKGAECGRCLTACPGDAVGHWTRDWGACDPYRNPHGFSQLTDYLGRIIDETDAEAQKAMLRSEDSFNLWQSILRGAGAITGCRRCQDVCPVGEDYDAMLKDALEELAEDTPEKQARLDEMKAAGEPPEYAARARWIGKLAGR